jgi:hypothetical protein
MAPVSVGDTVLEHGETMVTCSSPTPSVYSVTNEMRDGSLVEVATVGFQGMLGVNFSAT